MESAFAPWESFYVIIGSSAAALTGLQFVVIALGSESRNLGTEREINAFATPTIVHFCAVLLISSILSAPWHHHWPPALSLATSGIAGLIYTFVIIRRARRSQNYKPVLEDWIWHVITPFLSYGALAIAALFLPHHPTPSLFLIAAAALLLLFTGIHNAWDAVIYLALARRAKLTEGPIDRS
jgi:putative flippase GtrA